MLPFHRYERLDEDMQEAINLINSRRPTGLPPIAWPPVSSWRNKGTVTITSAVNSTDAAAFVYAPRYRACGGACVEGIANFFESDLKFFGWSRPGPAPSASPVSRAAPKPT